MMHGKAIWSSDKRIAAVFNNLRNNIRTETGYRGISSGYSLRSFRLIIRVDGSLVWDTAQVICLATAVVISTLRVRDLEEKVMG